MKSLQDLNDGDSDGLALAVQVFAPDGSLLPHLSSSSSTPSKKKDLSSGGCLVLSYLHISPSFRRQGFAKLLLQELVRRARGKKGGIKWVFVKPGVIRDDFKEEIEGLDEEGVQDLERRALGGARGFYRDIGFEEIGGSEWLVLDVHEVFGGVAGV